MRSFLTGRIPLSENCEQNLSLHSPCRIRYTQSWFSSTRQCIVSKAHAAARRSHSCSHLSPCLVHLLARVAVAVGCSLKDSATRWEQRLAQRCLPGWRLPISREIGRADWPCGMNARVFVQTTNRSLCKGWINPVCCPPTTVEHLLPLESETRFSSTFRIGNLFVEASASLGDPIVFCTQCHSSQCRHGSPTAPAGSTQEEVRPGGITLASSGACVCSTAMWQSVPPRGL